MKNKASKNLALLSIAALSTIHGAFAQSNSDNNAQTDWKANTISPVTSPIYFEDPRIDSELRPIFMDHRLPNTFHFQGGSVPLGGDIKVFAAQLRLALTDRLAFIATKDGYIMSQPDHTLSHTYGWAGITGGFKYALVDDTDSQFILTPGFTIEVPTGDNKVFQTHGAGLWNLFTSAEKGWNDLHVTGNLGFLIPDDFSKQTAQAHYALQLDYRTCQYFTPFIVGNGYTVLSEGNNKLLGAVDLNTEFYDLGDFGSTKAQGQTQVTLGAGFRSRLCRAVDMGFAYEFGATHPQGIFKDRFTVDLIWHF